MKQPDEYDPDQTIWSAVEELERKGFTHSEIMRSMEDVYGEIPVDRHEHE